MVHLLTDLVVRLSRCVHVEQDALSDLVTPWLIFYALAVAVSLLAIFIKLKVLYRQIRCGPRFGKERDNLHILVHVFATSSLIWRGVLPKFLI